MNVTTILALISAFPEALTQITALWTAIRDEFSSSDQATIDAALADAQTKDAADTATADTALDAASKR